MKKHYLSNKVYIYSTTCSRRKVDIKKVSVFLKKNTYELTDDPSKADYILYFSCGLTNLVNDECNRLINSFKKFDGELIVAGCLVDIAGEDLKKNFSGRTISMKKIDEIDKIFDSTNIKFDEIDDQHHMFNNYSPFNPEIQPIRFFKEVLEKNKILKKWYIWSKTEIIPILFGRIYPSLRGGVLLGALCFQKTMLPDLDVKYFIISISNGCTFNCTYCADKKAIGNLRSENPEKIIEYFKKGLDQRYKHFVIDADDVGAYGQDINKNFVELLDKITDIKGDYSLYLNNTHPYWVNKYMEEFEKVLSKGKIKQINIAIQSGNDRILKLMKRIYDRRTLEKILTGMKKAYSGLALNTHIIVGFPTETDEEFFDTFELFKNIEFKKGNILAYSPIKSTESYKIEPKVDKKILKKRMNIYLNFLRKNNYLAWKINIGIVFMKDKKI